jgi:hypothetical protein
VLYTLLHLRKLFYFRIKQVEEELVIHAFGQDFSKLVLSCDRVEKLFPQILHCHVFLAALLLRTHVGGHDFLHSGLVLLIYGEKLALSSSARSFTARIGACIFWLRGGTPLARVVPWVGSNFIQRLGMRPWLKQDFVLDLDLVHVRRFVFGQKSHVLRLEIILLHAQSLQLGLILLFTFTKMCV